MAECSCIIHFRYSRKYCNGCNFFATECVMICPTLTKLPLEYSLFSCHKLTKYDFGIQFGTKRSQVQILSPRPLKKLLRNQEFFLFAKKHRSETGFEEAVMNEATVWPQNGADRRAVEALRIQSCHLDQKMPETERFPVLLLLINKCAVFSAVLQRTIPFFLAIDLYYV